MKKILTIVAIVTLFASCAKETPLDPVEKLEKVYVEGSVNVDTKATIGGMAWEKDDQIKVWVKSAMDVQGYDGDLLSINPSDRRFSGTIVKPQDTDVLYVAYNASGFDKSAEANYGPTFDIPAVQNTAAGGATKAMLKEEVEYNGGDLRNLSFTLSSATARLKITVTEGVTNVVFAGMSDEIITNGSTTLTYSGSSATDVEFVVPAITFSNGYKITYTNSRGTMYQSYNSGKSVSFVAGTSRNITCNFVPFSISCEIDATNAPKTSYDYYLAGNLTKANSADFETVGRLSGGTSENPWQYDEDAQGIFTGKIERGKAKIVINGASSRVIPDNLTIKEYGCYVKRVGGQEGKDVYATAQSIALTKNFTWDVMYKVGQAAMIEADAGDFELKPYIIVNDGAADAEYVAPTAYTLHVTGLPHRSDHKDLWYVCEQGLGNTKVSGVVRRHPDDNNYPIDMFEQTQTGSWRDYCVRSRQFNIPAETKAQVIMHGTLWAPHSINAYFWFDATNNSFVFHKDIDRTGANGEKLKNLNDCDAYDEESQARQHTKYLDLGETNTETGVTYGHVNDNTIVLSPANPAANVYLWIHRGTTASLFESVGYWCRWIKVQYAAKNN